LNKSFRRGIPKSKFRVSKIATLKILAGTSKAAKIIVLWRKDKSFKSLTEKN
jgi:hypothetical protein